MINLKKKFGIKGKTSCPRSKLRRGPLRDNRAKNMGFRYGKEYYKDGDKVIYNVFPYGESRGTVKGKTVVTHKKDHKRIFGEGISNCCEVDSLHEIRRQKNKNDMPDYEGYGN